MATICVGMGAIIPQYVQLATALAVIGGAFLLGKVMPTGLVWTLALLVMSVEPTMFGGEKQYVASIDAKGLVLAALCLSLLVRLDRASLTAAFRKQYIYGLFLLWCASSIFFSPTQIDGVRLVVQLAMPLGFYLGASNPIFHRQNPYWYRSWLFGLSVCVVGLSIGLIFMGTGYRIGWESTDTIRLSGSLGSNYTSFVLCPVLLYLYSSINGGLEHGTRSGTLILLVILSGFMVLLGTRSAIMAIVVSLTLTHLLTGQRFKSMVCVIAACLMLWFLPNPVNRFLSAESSLGSSPLSVAGRGVLTGTLVGRFDPWVYAWNEYFLASPFFGQGLGSTSLILRQQLVTSGSGALHNEPLRLLSEVGIIGFGLFMIAFASVIRRLFSSWRDAQGESRVLVFAALSSVMAYIIISFFDNVFLTYPFGIVVWLVVGLADHGYPSSSET